MTGKQILMIDNEESIRANVLRVLRMEGYVAREAENGVAGLASINAHKPDLILCDVMMPEMDGFAVLKELRASAGTASIPFIFLSAGIESESKGQALAQGADGYLAKPFMLAELLALVRRSLARRTVAQSL